jgi:hypothetical protein
MAETFVRNAIKTTGLFYFEGWILTGVSIKGSQMGFDPSLHKSSMVTITQFMR